MYIGTTMIYENTGICFTAGAFQNHAWDKFIVAPFIGSGSPVDQTMMVRNLKLYDGLGAEIIEPPAGAELVGDWSSVYAWDSTTPVDSNYLKFYGDGHIKIGGNGHFKVLP